MRRLLLGVLLILSMVMGAVTIAPKTANAAGPFYIYTQEGLQSVGQADDPGHTWSSGNSSFDTWGMDDDYVLMANLTLTGNFIPIGHEGIVEDNDVFHPFLGTFNGNGYTITNLNISKPTYTYVGLFARVGSASLSNVPLFSNISLINPIISGKGKVGSLAGYISQLSVNPTTTNIVNCSATNPVIMTTDDSGGGLVGGGLFNMSYSHVINISINQPTHNHMGGLVGYSYGNIYRCYVRNGSITSSYYAGGLIGSSYSGYTINDSYAENVSVNSITSGGLIGNNPTGAIVINSYSTGTVTGSTSNGFTNAGTVTDCYWDLNTSAKSTSGRGTGKTTTEMMNISTFSTWSIAESSSYTNQTWWIQSGTTYPRLGWETLPASNVYLTMTLGSGGASITPTDGVHTYTANEVVNISATANTNYHFTNWTGNTSSIGNVNAASTNISMGTSNKSATANFAEDTYYTFTYNANANGTINGSSPQKVYAGYNGSSVIPTPNSCYHFVNWSDSSTDNPRTDLNAAGDINVSANFGIDTYTFTYNAGGNGSVNGSTSQNVNCGSNGSEVEAVPNLNYHFVNWSDSVATAKRTDLNASGDITVTANFAEDAMYTFTYTAGSGGTINGTSPQSVYTGNNGSEVEAIPNACYSFVKWSDDVMTAKRTDTNAVANISVTAQFAIIQYTLTYNAGTGGTINGTTPQTVNCSTNGSLVTATPNIGYHFLNWSDAVATPGRTDLNIVANLTVTANFAIDVKTVTYSAGSNGTVNGSWPENVNYGSNSSWVLASPNSCYHFVNWSDSSTTNPRQEVNVTSNVSFTANFAINVYTVMYTAGSGGTVNSSWPQNVNCGSNGPAVLASPTFGHYFVNWSDSSTTNPRYETNVTSNLSFTANFGGYTEDTVNIYPYKDNYLDQAAPTTNYGTQTYAYVVTNYGGGSDNNARTILSFDLSGVPIVINSANLSMYLRDYPLGDGWAYPNNAAMWVYRLTEPDWVETTSYWNRWDVGHSWTGGTYDAGYGVSTTISNTEPQWYNWLVTDMATYSINNSLDMHMLLKWAAESEPVNDWHRAQFDTREGANKPYLTVKYYVIFPDVNTVAATNVSYTTATLNGNVSDDNGFDGEVRFRYRTTGVGTWTTTSWQDNGGSYYHTGDTYSQNISSLSQATSYEFQAQGRDEDTLTESGWSSSSYLTTKILYTFTYIAGSHGTVSGTTTQYVDGGEDGTEVEGIPNACYSFVKWSDNVMTAARTDTNATGNITVTATFAIIPYTLHYGVSGTGTLTGNTSQTVDCGGNGTQVTAVAGTCYAFTQWSDGVMTASRTDLNVVANINVTAIFNIRTYTFTYTSDAGGHLTGNTTQVVNCGSNGSLVTAVPTAGYDFVKWSDNVMTAGRTDLNAQADKTVNASYLYNPFIFTNASPSGTFVSGSGNTTLSLTVTHKAGLNSSVAFRVCSNGSIVNTGAPYSYNVVSGDTVSKNVSMAGVTYWYAYVTDATPYGKATPNYLVTVNTPPVITPTMPTNGSTQSTPVTLGVNVSDANSHAITVSFYNVNGSVLLNTSTVVNGSASYNWSPANGNQSWYATAYDGFDTTTSNTSTFYSFASPPVLTTNPVAFIPVGQATLYGHVDINDASLFACNLYFQYRLNGSAVWIDSATQVITVDGVYNYATPALTVATNYEWRLKLDYVMGIAYSAVAQFTTPSIPVVGTPIVITLGTVTYISPSTATLGGSINLSGNSGAYFWFVYGESSWPYVDWYYAPYGSTAVSANISQALVGLIGGTDYGYYIVGIDYNGSTWVYSAVGSFTTTQSTIGWAQKLANMMGLHDANGRLLFAMLFIVLIPGILYAITKKTFISLLAAVALVGLFAALTFISIWVILVLAGFLVFGFIKVIGAAGAAGGEE